MINNSNKNDNAFKRRLQISFDDTDYQALANLANAANRSIAAQARHWIQEKLRQAEFESKKEKFYNESLTK